MSEANPSPVTEGDTSEKRTDDEPTCRNGNSWCPVDNPTVEDALECFDCHQDLSRVDERPANVSRTPFVGF